jgi:hypothetical protein
MAVSRELHDEHEMLEHQFLSIRMSSTWIQTEPPLSTISAIAIRAHRNLQVILSSENEINYLKFLVL